MRSRIPAACHSIAARCPDRGMPRTQFGGDAARGLHRGCRPALRSNAAGSASAAPAQAPCPAHQHELGSRSGPPRSSWISRAMRLRPVLTLRCAPTAGQVFARAPDLQVRDLVLRNVGNDAFPAHAGVVSGRDLEAQVHPLYFIAPAMRRRPSQFQLPRCAPQPHRSMNAESSGRIRSNKAFASCRSSSAGAADQRLQPSLT